MDSVHNHFLYIYLSIYSSITIRTLLQQFQKIPIMHTVIVLCLTWIMTIWQTKSSDSGTGPLWTRPKRLDVNMAGSMTGLSSRRLWSARSGDHVLFVWLFTSLSVCCCCCGIYGQKTCVKCSNSSLGIKSNLLRMCVCIYVHIYTYTHIQICRQTPT